MDAIKRHWDIRSSDYNDFVVRGFSIDRERRSWQEHFTSILGSEPLDILDVGCGPGIVSMQLADLGHRMTSVDLSDRMLEYARENASVNGFDIDFHQADAMGLPFDAGPSPSPARSSPSGTGYSSPVTSSHTPTGTGSPIPG